MEIFRLSPGLVEREFPFSFKVSCGEQRKVAFLQTHIDQAVGLFERPAGNEVGQLGPGDRGELGGIEALSGSEKRRGKCKGQRRPKGTGQGKFLPALLVELIEYLLQPLVLPIDFIHGVAGEPGHLEQFLLGRLIGPVEQQGEREGERQGRNHEVASLFRRDGAVEREGEPHIAAERGHGLLPFNNCFYQTNSLTLKFYTSWHK